MDRLLMKDGESEILFTPRSRTGDFLSSSSGRSLEIKGAGQIVILNYCGVMNVPN